MSPFYIIIFVLITFYIIWSWNSTKNFETPIMRVSYLAIGTLFITIVTLIIFQISKWGVTYPKEEMIGEVRRMVLLIFVPINGFIVLTQSANLMSQIKGGILSKEETKKRATILACICAFLIIFECIYFKSIQTGMIKFINAK